MDVRYLPLLAEECAEVVQAVMKAERFGLDDSHPSYNEGRSNRDAILREIGDVMAVISLLITVDTDDTAVYEAENLKLKKLDKFGPDGSYFQDRKG